MHKKLFTSNKIINKKNDFSFLFLLIATKIKFIIYFSFLNQIKTKIPPISKLNNKITKTRKNTKLFTIKKRNTSYLKNTVQQKQEKIKQNTKTVKKGESYYQWQLIIKKQPTG